MELIKFKLQSQNGGIEVDTYEWDTVKRDKHNTHREAGMRAEMLDNIKKRDCKKMWDFLSVHYKVTKSGIKSDLKEWNEAKRDKKNDNINKKRV